MIIYASRTGNVKYIVSKLNLPAINIKEVEDVNIPFVLFTYTDGLGLVPRIVEDFLNQHHGYCKGVIASGNTNFGINNFCGSADKISQQYGIPIIHKLDLRGKPTDYEYIIDQYKNIMGGF